MSELRSKHAFGSSKKLGEVLAAGTVNAFDILYLDGDTDKPLLGWVKKDGNPTFIDTENVVVIEDEALPESGKTGKIYIFNDEGYFWSGAEFISLSKPADLTSVQEQLDKKADITQVTTALETFEEKVNEKIAEEVAIEVIEF